MSIYQTPNPYLNGPWHPRPDHARENHLLLDGQWQFAQDPDDIGIREEWFRRDALPLPRYCRVISPRRRRLRKTPMTIAWARPRSAALNVR
jgi:hypothetical protein